MDERASEPIAAASVPDALFEGAEDENDVLPYARTHGYILVTNDLQHFSNRREREHEGIVLVYDGTLRPRDIASGIRTIVEAYGERDRLRGYEVLDSWL